MPAEYYVQLKSPAGIPTAVITDAIELGYVKRIWEPGLAIIKLFGNHKDVPKFENNCQIEIYRRNLDFGINWYCDFYGLYEKQEYTTPANIDYFYAHCPGQMNILSWVCVAYPDKLPLISTFTAQKAETIMKNLVKYNMTSLAVTGNGRIVSFPFGNLQQVITVETDLGRGTVQDWKASTLNLLSTLQDLAKVAGGDFDLVKTGNSTWDFRFYPGQRGTDRTTTLVFSPSLSNMGTATYEYDRIGEATIAIIGGRGDGVARNFNSVVSSGYNTNTNYKETFVSASQNDTDAFLITKGQQTLYQMTGRKKLQATILQTKSTQYGREYFLGDLVSAYYHNLSFTQKIFGVTVGFKPKATNPESIGIEMQDA